MASLAGLVSRATQYAFFILELYEDEKGWAAHQETEHFKTLIKDLLPRVDKRERVPFVPYVPA